MARGRPRKDPNAPTATPKTREEKIAYHKAMLEKLMDEPDKEDVKKAVSIVKSWTKTQLDKFLAKHTDA